MSKIEVIKNPKFAELNDFLDELPEHFAMANDVIFAERNDTRKLSYEYAGRPYQLAVKSFKVPNKLRRFVYTYFRQSKAMRSYLHSLQIGSFAVEPIAVYEVYKEGLIEKTYFVSTYFDFDFEMQAVINDPDFPDREAILEKFSEFTWQLHEANIFHNDYSSRNILVKKDAEDYVYKLVDVNRMDFSKMPLKKRITSFWRLSLSEQDTQLVMNKYEELMGAPKDSYFKVALDVSRARKKRYWQVRNFKKRVKKLFSIK